MTFDKALEEIESRASDYRRSDDFGHSTQDLLVWESNHLETVQQDCLKLLAVVKEMRGALNEVRKESLIQVPCPDGVVGCAVLHRKLDSRGKLASEALTKCDEIMGEE